MIIQPDFLRHWKTRKLIMQTYPAAPLALIRLWSHCQTSRKWEFPELKKDDLASICEWDFPNISCEKALIASGWILKMPSGGYIVRNWDEHNKSLIMNWERNPSGKKKDASEGDPTGSPTATRPDKTRPDRLDKTRPDQTRLDDSPRSESAVDSSGMVSKSSFAGLGGSDGLVAGLASSFKTNGTTPPTLRDVENFLEMCFAGAGRYAKSFHKTMEKQHWRDKDRNPLTSWQSVARSYASSAALKRLKP